MFTLSGASVEAYVAACREAIDTATNGGFEWNLAIVQIDLDFKELPGPDNPYFATKAVFLKQRVPVQEITLDTIRFSNEQLVFALNNMRLATYAKIGGVRLIFHVFKQMADREADAVGKLVENLGLTDVKYAFLHIVDDHRSRSSTRETLGIAKKTVSRGSARRNGGLP